MYLRPWPALDASYPISSGGGTEPIWSRDGRELYYRHEGEVLAVAIAERAGRIERTQPRLLFTGPYVHDVSGDQSWGLAADGRFLRLRPVPGGRAVVQVALNWIDGIRARLEAGR